jgi:hypothetical protein
MPVAQESNRPAKPSAPRLRARLDAGLGNVRRWAAPLVLGTLAACLRFRRPPGGGRRASGLDARTLGGGLLLMAASLALNILPPPLLPPSAVWRHALCRALFLSLFVITPSAIVTSGPPLSRRSVAASRRP